MYIGAKCESNSMRIQASQKRNKVMTVATQGLNEEIAYTRNYRTVRVGWTWKPQQIHREIVPASGSTAIKET